MKNVILSVRSLEVRTLSRAILGGVSFELQESELVSVVGPSGSGKSTLLRALNRLAGETPGLMVSGEVLYHGQNIFSCCRVHELRKNIGMLFQKPCVYPGSILRNVLFGVKHHQKLNAKLAADISERSLRKAHLWEEVKDRLHHPAFELSMGQKQRLCFARLLAVDPEILLLDEPTANLDPHSTLEIEKTLMELKDSKSIILVTHLLSQARRLSDRVIMISAASGTGIIVEDGSAAEFFENPKALETQAYLKS